MKKSLDHLLPSTLLLLAFLFPFARVIAQAQPVPPVQFRTDDPSPRPSSWFATKKVAEGVWCIDDHGSANVYVVTGSDSALVIDTGIGSANLRDYVKSLTSLPLIIVNTHGHPDHSGANYQFGLPVYANARDFDAIRPYNSFRPQSGAASLMTGGATVSQEDAFTDTLNLKPVEMKAVGEGYRFDLGGRTLEVIEVPGHTRGSICLLDAANKILFTGDNDNVLVWLHLPGCAPLETYLSSLEKLVLRSGEFTALMPGHGTPIESSFIDDQISCVKSILDGSCKGEETKTFAGNGRSCTYKKATVLFNPDNLFNSDQ